MQDKQIQANQQAIETEKMADASEAQLERDKDIRVAEIRAASATGLVDINKNEQSDYIDTLEYLDKKEERKNRQATDREKLNDKRISDQKMINLKREDMRSKEKISEDKLKVAKQNKNKYDFKSKKS